MSKYDIISLRISRRPRLDERGIALLLTLLVTIILAVVVLEVNYLMRVHATLSGNLLDSLKAETAARSAVEKAKALLLNDFLADYKKGLASDALDEGWAAEIRIETKSGVADATISDEMGKINLNRLVKRPAAAGGAETPDTAMVESVKRLFELLELDPNLIDCIIDWIDENDQEEPFGAENPYYESLTPLMNSKDGPLDSVDELLFVKGFDSKILYGDDEKPGLVDFVTVCGDEHGFVNINTADEKVIAAIVNSESLASTIVDSRESSSFVSSEDLTTRVAGANLSGKFTVASSFFLVTSTARILPESLSGREVKIRTILRRVQPEADEQQKETVRIDTAFWKVER
ncbi:MAG: type II secretion system minor pseudopilin GspK [Candidatus Lindowbacteria bacterium]|nr:type II secretion system minor pseudopilin GspK [Candidatus Lindowbacteria bacterium]